VHTYEEATLCSATSVDVEEHLYRLATNMGITVITSSQVSIHHTLLISSWQFPCCSPSQFFFVSFLLIREIRTYECMTESLCYFFFRRGLL